MVAYKDYYRILGVDRKASRKDIHASFRKLARKYHPDANKSPDAEGRFKEINEAHEVLHNPEKRKRYDALGANWKNGQNFTPPPGWENIRMHFGGGPSGMGGMEFDLGGSDTSDFFDMLFGGSGFRGFNSMGFEPRGGMGGARPRPRETDITITLEEAFLGTKKRVALESIEYGPDGRPQRRVNTLDVSIPQGVKKGTRIRLCGKNESSCPTEGDIYLRVHISNHPVFEVDGHDLSMELPVAPWEAVLGGKVRIGTLDGHATVTVPKGSKNGQRLRLRGQGLHDRKGGRGDLYARIRIEVPRTVTDRERELFEELAETSSFDPRNGLGSSTS